MYNMYDIYIYIYINFECLLSACWRDGGVPHHQPKIYSFLPFFTKFLFPHHQQYSLLFNTKSGKLLKF